MSRGVTRVWEGPMGERLTYGRELDLRARAGPMDQGGTNDEDAAPSKMLR